MLLMFYGTLMFALEYAPAAMVATVCFVVVQRLFEGCADGRQL
jgi:hypothetical protein